MDRIIQGQYNGVRADENQGSYTTPSLPLLVEEMNKRSVISDVSKLGNSWKGTCRVCGTAKKREEEKGRKAVRLP